MLQFRRDRQRLLPAELFSEPAWDLLLELFVADAEGRGLSGREVSQRSNVAAPVMARWLMHLVNIGLVIRDGSGAGDLDDLLTLSGKAMDRMEKVIQPACTVRPLDD
ncbi:hypothetical protein [Sphingomonas sp. GB1N7]|uniref:hypothetical protein n=1 Tax=Parasphingomonas caseinilytica TaxID=3096158 RepID=UPI002FC943F9